MASISDQNWVVWNQGKNPLVNFNFMLRVEMLFDLPCKSVRAFSRELEYDYIQEGGLNDYVHMRRKPISRPFTLEIERYVGVDYIDPLRLGADLVLPVLLFVSRSHDQFIPGVVARTYVFTGCTVMKKTYGDLVADQSGLLVETTTLGYREMLCVDIPWSEVGDNISKDVKTTPTNAKTVDSKGAEELKTLGQALYEKALEAKQRAESEFVSNDMDALIRELDETLNQLKKAVSAGGVLAKAKDAAEAALKSADGKTKKQLADEAEAAVPRLKAEMDAAQAAWSEKETAYRRTSNDQNDVSRRPAETKSQPAEPDTELAETNTALESARSEADTARTKAESAAQAYRSAAQAYRSAAERARAARDAQSLAERALADAETAIRTSTKQISLLQNSLTNLKLRRESGKAAQSACAAQYDKCKQKNDELQSLPNDDEPAVNTVYGEVDKFSQSTCREERLVREACQYMEAARKLLSETTTVPEGTAASEAAGDPTT
jgi:hypothetical protein